MARNIEHSRGQRRKRWSLAIWGAAALLLLLPAVAMRFTVEVNWTAGNFIVMGAMLASACGAYEILARMSSNTSYRAAVGVAIVTGFLTVWVNLAVGMLGSEDNPANLLFFGVLAVGLVGAIVAWFRPRGMAIAMAATALAQAGMAVYALVGGYADVVPHVGFFAIAWLLSAQLFRKGAREQAAVGGER
ncbi:MAG: hypothetical protein M3Q40_10705 [Pseudomonadota bacterium]|nr:hypothetical protein [Pseudomonadota bacterium]